MTKYKPKKDKTEPERLIYNYDYRQIKSKQEQFERKNVISCSKLGFNDIESITEAVLDRVLNKVSGNYNHKPNLFNPNHEISPIKHIDIDSVKGDS